MIRKIFILLLSVLMVSACIDQLFAQTNEGNAGMDTTHYALRVVFVQYEVVAQPAGIELKWSTILETNLASYEIERSNDNSEFVSIGGLTALGTTSVAVPYNFMDEHPENGKNVYRLKMTDTRGGIYYSESRIQNWEKTETVTSAIRTFPNPVQRGAQLFIQAPDMPGNAYIRVLSMNGQLISQHSFTASHNSGFSISIPNNLQDGIYVVQIQNEDHSFAQSQKIIIN